MLLIILLIIYISYRHTNDNDNICPEGQLSVITGTEDDQNTVCCDSDKVVTVSGVNKCCDSDSKIITTDKKCCEKTQATSDKNICCSSGTKPVGNTCCSDEKIIYKDGAAVSCCDQPDKTPTYGYA